jgi:serine O-acetyltransferase
MTAAFIADIRRCADIDQGHNGVLRLFADSYGLQALLAYRLGRYLLRAGRRYYLWPLLLLCWPIYYVLSRCARVAYDIRLELSADIGPGFYIGHFGAIRARRCRIGANCSIGQLTTISAAADGRGPVIGDRVWIGAHTQIVGPHRIGSDATVGAGSVIQGDIPARSLCLGNPARLVRHNYNNRRILRLREAVAYPDHGDRDDLPLVSVIIPAYKAAAYIHETLESVFCQTYHNFELILINDGSPDTEEFERAIAPYRDRIVYIRQENRGPSAARNAGIRRARGEYLAFLDSDDAWYPTCLAAQIELALSRQPPCDLVYSDVLIYPDSQQRHYRISSTSGSHPSPETALRRAAESHGGGIRYSEICPSIGPVTFESLLREDCQAPTSCTMVRRQAAISAGLFDENLRRAEDYDLWLRIAHRASNMAYAREVLGKNRVVPGSLSQDNMKMLEGLVDVLRKLSTSLELSASERSALQNKLATAKAQVDLERGKASLLDGKYDQALASLRAAGSLLANTKLRLAQLGLKFAPRLTRAIVGAWLRGKG